MKRNEELVDEDEKVIKIKKLYFELGSSGDDVQVVSDGTVAGTTVFVNDKKLGNIADMQFSLKAGEIGKLGLSILVMPRKASISKESK